MIVRQLIEQYNCWRGLRVATHSLFWALMWLFTQNYDQHGFFIAHLVGWGYILISFYVLFYWFMPRIRIQSRHRILTILVLGTGTVLISGLVMYWEERLTNPRSGYDFLADFEIYGVITIFFSGSYFFYAFFNGLIIKLSGPGVLKIAKTLYEQQLNRYSTEQLTRQLHLDTLLDQVNPHFLFNTLNNLYGLVLQEDPRARTIAHRLAALIRYSDELAEQACVTLKREAEFIEDFLSLTRLRYGEQVSIESQWLTDAEATVGIPPLLLLPLVENAFKHGVNQSVGVSWVRIISHVEKGEVIFTVSNSRTERSCHATVQNSGLGLATLRKRLQLLYPGTTPLVVHSNATTFVASLRLPLLHAAPAPHRNLHVPVPPVAPAPFARS